MKTLSLVVSSSERGKPQPALYVGLSGDTPHAQPVRLSLGNTSSVTIVRGAQRTIERSRKDGLNGATLSLDDARLSSQHARLMGFGGSWVIDDLGSKNGVFVGGVRVKRRQLADNDVIMVGHTAIVFREAGGELGDHIGLPPAMDAGLMTFSTEAAARFEELAAAAASPLSIELTGASGTGKELAARAVHALSGRRGRFVAVNCGALPQNLVEAELFGHTKGAFTGAADDRPGLIRSADGGTLFLDEVAELPLTSQAALLRVLQEREVTPVGGDRPIKVDVRLVTATLRDLDSEIAARRFREDLRARLMGVRVEIPPLRDRLEDLGWLTSLVLRSAIGQRAVTFSMDAVTALYRYDWPLNIRELDRTIAAAALRQDIKLDHLPRALRDALDDAPAAAEELSPEDVTLREQLVAAIETHKGNLSAVARQLGKDRKQIQRWVKRFGLTREG